MEEDLGLFLKSNSRPFVEALLEAFSIFRDPYIICMCYVVWSYVLTTIVL